MAERAGVIIDTLKGRDDPDRAVYYTETYVEEPRPLRVAPRDALAEIDAANARADRLEAALIADGVTTESKIAEK
jgi:hypothetical protein